MHRNVVNAVLVKPLPDPYQSRYNSSVINVFMDTSSAINVNRDTSYEAFNAKQMDTILSAINVSMDTSSAFNVKTDTSS